MNPLERSRILLAIARGSGVVRLEGGGWMQVASEGRVEFQWLKGGYCFRNATPAEEDFISANRAAFEIAILADLVAEVFSIPSPGCGGVETTSEG